MKFIEPQKRKKTLNQNIITELINKTGTKYLVGKLKIKHSEYIQE